MSGVNKVILVARLGKDPETRYMPNRDAVTNFTAATSEDWKDKTTGEKKSRVEWHRIVVFGKLGEICGEYLQKGSQCYLEGRLQTREWEDRDGNKRYTTKIVASEVQFLGGKGERQEPKPQSEPDLLPGSGNDLLDDDIPF